MSTYDPASSASSPSSYAQLVIGPPGSGKTTYCQAMKAFLSSLGRKVAIVNLDPANDSPPYECQVDISELISLEEVMDRLSLGPNGSLVYCMEFLEKNLAWLHTQVQKFKGQYFLFDCPGQVELFTHHKSVKNIAAQLQKWNFKVFRFFLKLCVAQLPDIGLERAICIPQCSCANPVNQASSCSSPQSFTNAQKYLALAL